MEKGVEKSITLPNQVEPSNASQHSAEVTGPVRRTIAVWSRDTTLSLLGVYKQLRNKVRTSEMKSMRKFWEVIALVLNKIHGTNFTFAHCQNRWKVIARNYKKYVEDSKKTGRRKYFEYATEMDQIFGRKKNLHFQQLLSNERVHQDDHTTALKEQIQQVIEAEPSPSNSTENTQVPKTCIEVRRRKRMTPQTKNLELMRKDKKEYYDKLLALKTEKINFDKMKFQEKLALEKLKLSVKEKKNQLKKEKNDILKQCLKCNVKLPESLL